jgi:predicted nucleic acid-binding protein
MPLFTVPEIVLDLHRRAVMLDTNVVYGAFSLRDQRHHDCLAYLELEEQYLLPVPVIIETWGMLVGRDRNWDAGFEFLDWLRNPSSGAIIVNHVNDFGRIHDLARSARVDCVDATILFLADEITRRCGYVPGLRVATFDTADFLRSLSVLGFKITLVDLNSLEDIELSE